MPDQFETIRVAVEEGLQTITLDRPSVLNAFNIQMLREIVTALDMADADDAVRAVIVTGAGDWSFCAGADLTAGEKTFDSTDSERWSEAGRRFALMEALIGTTRAFATSGACWRCACLRAESR